MTHSSKVKLHGRMRINVRRHDFHQESRFLKCVIEGRAKYILLAIKVEVSFEGPFPRSVPIPRWKRTFQQLSKFLAASIQSARSITAAITTFPREQRNEVWQNWNGDWIVVLPMKDERLRLTPMRKYRREDPL